MDFIQCHHVDKELCTELMGRLTIPETAKNPAALKADIEELGPVVKNFSKEYFHKISEFNYFAHPTEQDYYVQYTYFNYIPPWNFVIWDSERGGDYLNFYLFLKDTEAFIEFFNPFLRKTERFRGAKGLCVVVPSNWMFIKRFTNTFKSDAIFISGGIGINDLDNMK